jgi:hypothetical protein
MWPRSDRPATAGHRGELHAAAGVKAASLRPVRRVYAFRESRPEAYYHSLLRVGLGGEIHALLPKAVQRVALSREGAQPYR